jgi:autotransporter-associated beta strand protein
MRMPSGSDARSSEYVHLTANSGLMIGRENQLYQSGSGTLTLTVANTFTGNLALTHGVVTVGHDSALGAGSLSLQGDTLQATGRPAPRGTAIARLIAIPACTGNEAAANSKKVDPQEYSGAADASFDKIGDWLSAPTRRDRATAPADETRGKSQGNGHCSPIL